MSPSQDDSLLVTGSSGLVGEALVAKLGVTSERLDVTKDEGWHEAFTGKTRVIHCAAIASSRGVDTALVEAVNLDGTKRIARIASDCGVKRFLFVSSVKVLGESTQPGQRFSDRGPLNPGSVYAHSKAMAEEAIWEIHEPGGFEVVVIRPTVVVAPQAKGAIGTMAKLARRGVPFPVASSGNQRDFVSLDNLVDAILHALEHPDAAGKAFSVTDGETLSTGELFRGMGEAFGRKGQLVPIPSNISRRLAGGLGKEAAWERLFGNLEVDGSLIRDTLSWKPTTTTLEYVREAFPGYASSKQC